MKLSTWIPLVAILIVCECDQASCRAIRIGNKRGRTKERDLSLIIAPPPRNSDGKRMFANVKIITLRHKQLKRRCAKTKNKGRKCKVFNMATEPRSERNLRRLRSTAFCYVGDIPVAYSPTTQLCCDDGLYNKTEDGYQRSCCGGSMYNIGLDVCCNEKLLRHKEGSKCCGDRTYHVATEVCCGNTTISLEDSICCVDQVYERIDKRARCCGRTLIQREDFYGSDNKNGTCCGGINVDRRCFRCENDTRVPKFDENLFICCRGNRVEKLHGIYTICCGGNAIDGSKFACRDGLSIQTKQSLYDMYQSVAYSSAFMTTATLGVREDNGTDFEEQETIKDSPTGHQTILIGVSSVGGLFAIALVVVTGIRKSNCLWTLKHLCSKRSARQSIVFKPVSNMSSPDNHGYDFTLNNMSPETGPSASAPSVGEDSGILSRSTDEAPPLLAPTEEEAVDTIVAGELLLTGPISDEGYATQEDPVSSSSVWSSFDPSVLKKEIKTVGDNLLESFFADVATQTAVKKASNKRNIFGMPFEYSTVVTASTRVVQKPNSPVKMILPESLFLDRDSVEVLVSTPARIPAIRRKFSFKEEVWLASPTVEYCLTGNPKLVDFAVVIIPFKGNAKDLKVWKFPSDEGAFDTAKTIPVPEKSNAPDDADVFFTFVDGENAIRVHTKTFSGFFCDSCGERELVLEGKVYASYVESQISIAFYVVDITAGQFSQYEEPLKKIEEKQGREKNLMRPIRLPTDTTLTPKDFLRISGSIVMPGGQWENFKKGDGSFFHEPELEVKLEEVVRCHVSTELPYAVDFWFVKTDGHGPFKDVKCMIEVDCCHHDDGRKLCATTPIQIALTNSGASVDAAIPPNNPEVDELKVYLTRNLSSGESTSVLKELREKFSIDAGSLEEVLAKLERRNTPLGFQESLANTLNKVGLKDHLQRLVKDRVIPEMAVPRPAQETASLDADGAMASGPFNAVHEDAAGNAAHEAVVGILEPRPELSNLPSASENGHPV